MKQFLVALFVSVLVMPAYAVERFLPGDHYLIVGDASAPKPVKANVIEFFSYGCPHCEHLEPYLNAWLKDKKQSVEFSRVPAQWNKYFKELGHLYLALEHLGVADQHSAAVFKYIHKQKKELRKASQIMGFAEHQLGIDRASFEAAWNAKEVKAKLKEAGVKLRQYKVSGVPSLLVNGRYYVSVKTAGSEEALFEVADFLIQK